MCQHALCHALSTCSLSARTHHLLRVTSAAASQVRVDQEMDGTARGEDGFDSLVSHHFSKEFARFLAQPAGAGGIDPLTDA